MYLERAHPAFFTTLVVLVSNDTILAFFGVFPNVILQVISNYLVTSIFIFTCSPFYSDESTLFVDMEAGRTPAL